MPSSPSATASSAPSSTTNAVELPVASETEHGFYAMLRKPNPEAKVPTFKGDATVLTHSTGSQSVPRQCGNAFLVIPHSDGTTGTQVINLSAHGQVITKVHRNGKGHTIHSFPVKDRWSIHCSNDTTKGSSKCKPSEVSDYVTEEIAKLYKISKVNISKTGPVPQYYSFDFSDDPDEQADEDDEDPEEE